MKKNIFEIDTADLVIIHVLTNDIKYICYDQFWKSDFKKENDLIELAHNFVKLIKQLIAQYPDLKIIIDMVLKRFDKKDELKIYSTFGNQIINVEISKCLLEAENVILVKNDDMDILNFENDKFHLLKKSFLKLLNKWIAAIGK